MYFPPFNNALDENVLPLHSYFETLFYYAHSWTVNSIKPCAATILGYDNQHILETKIFLGFFAIQNSIQEVICSFVGYKKKKKKSGLRWFEPAESLVAKPSAVTKIKTAPQRARWDVCECVCVCVSARTRVAARLVMWHGKLPNFF